MKRIIIKRKIGNFFIHIFPIIAVIAIIIATYLTCWLITDIRNDQAIKQTQLKICLENAKRHITPDGRVAVICRDLDGQEKLFYVEK